MLRIEVLPAGCGDCLWIEYGDPARPRRLLIDGGVGKTAELLAYRIRQAVVAQGGGTLYVDLAVVTHIDCDHIDGILALLQRRDLPTAFGDIWFNGSPQLIELLRLSSLLGVPQGEALSELLEQSALPWNRRFARRAAMIPDSGPLPAADLGDGLTLTLLGPTRARLETVWDKWREVVDSRGRDAAEVERRDLLGRTWPPQWDDAERSDRSIPNGSSISLLLEHGNRRVLLAGDAYSGDLEAAIGRLPAGNGRWLALDAFKLSHHGSAGNLMRSLLERLACERYIISTDGSVHRHPDNLALLRILRYSRLRPCLMFNHETDDTAHWRDDRPAVFAAIGQHDYGTAYPLHPNEGLVIDWHV